MSLSVVIRSDASVRMGTGHVMRCLTLARALAARGHRCRFVIRDLAGHMGVRIREEGFELTVLPPPEGQSLDPDAQPLALILNAAWAEVPYEHDAAQTRAAAEGADWLVVDHYAFDAAWQAATLPPGARLLVIDDLADRPHLADLLLDQNLGRRRADYDGLLSSGAERLIGPRYALLRPEFAAARPAALAARRGRGYRLAHVLVTMGGVDLPNATGAALSALAAHPGLHTTVVMGANAPALPAVRAQAAAMPNPAAILVNTPEMAALMAEADLVIGAAGGTAWERCVLGLPALIAVLADNQAPAAAALHASGAAVSLGRPGESGFAVRLAEALEQAAEPARLSAMSAAAAAVADGRGVQRVVAALENPLHLRLATNADAEAIWHWRRDLPTELFRTGSRPPLQDHLSWFAHALNDPNRRLFAFGDPACAHLRLDLAPSASAAVSILLSPEARGSGLGIRLLALLADVARREGIVTLTAEIHPSNAASLALFRGAGYAPTGCVDGFETFALSL